MGGLANPKEWLLGFLDVRVRIMNICLLAKWLERLETEEDSLCVGMLRKKYLGNRSIFQINRMSGHNSREVYCRLDTGFSGVGQLGSEVGLKQVFGMTLG